MMKGPAGKSFLCICITVLFGSHAACADMLVIQSSVPQYPIGSTIADGEIPKLPPGESVKVLVRPSNKTVVFSGDPREKKDTGGLYGGGR
jgi:hypothetical protein